MAANNKPNAKDAKTPKRKPVTGFAPMTFKDFTITQKRSGRYAVVTTKSGKNLNGKDKEGILLDAKLLQPSLPKAEAATT